MLNRYVVMLLAVLLPAGVVVADEAAEEKAVRAAIAKVMPAKVDSVEKSTIVPGLYEVIVGTQVFYMTPDGKYLLQGDIFNLETRTNVTDEKRSVGRKKVIASLPEESMIIFSPEKPKYQLTIFTDIDCGYCRKLHSEIDSYMKEGIKIRYLAFPRSGPNSPSFDKAVSVWCDKDRKQAITRAKAGGMVKKMDKPCNNPVAQHYNAGQVVGVTGTPSLVLDNGKVIPGYVPANRLKVMMEQELK